MKYFLSIIILCLLSVCVFADYNPSKGEVRGIWINSDKMPKTEAETHKLVKEYYNAGFNLLFPEVICRGYAVYPSDILERDPRFKESCDMLKTMIDDAHALKMEVHPWVWCFRAGYTNHPGAIIGAHPEWLECSMNKSTLSVNGGMWISPAIKEVREYLLSLYKEIVSDYDVDGFHLDYIRYESQTPFPYGYSQAAREKYMKETGYRNPLFADYLSRDYFRWNSFREEQINEFVSEISSELKKIKPEMILSAAVAMDPIEARYNYMQNWSYWADMGWVDMIVPMTYVTDDYKFSKKMGDQLKKLDNKVWNAVGIGSHNFTKNEQRNIKQIELARKTEYTGQALFASQYMTESLENMLKKNVWQDHAGLPFALNKAKGEKIAKFRENKQDMPAKSLEEEMNIDIENILAIPSYVCYEKNTDIVIDGQCDTSEWMPYNTAVIRYNNMGESAPCLTYVKMTYDDEAFYLCYICNETEMNQIKAKAKERDGNTFYDDSVELFIQPFNDQQKYNQFSVNTLNTQFDQQIYNVSWNKNWKSAVKKYPNGWQCEMRIPFKEMGMEKVKKLSHLRMNFTRNRAVTDEVENLCWSVTYGTFHTTERFGYVFFQ